jgi:hypothetical protein
MKLVTSNYKNGFSHGKDAAPEAKAETQGSELDETQLR